MADRKQIGEYRGKWWLPDHSDNKIMGILRYNSNKGIELELIDSFFPIGELMNKDYHPRIILGTSADGKDITLYKCFELSKTIVSSGNCNVTYSPSIIFVGSHFDERITFKSIIVDYSYLDEWVNINGFNISRPNSEGLFSMTYKKPEKINVTLNENYGISIGFSSHGPNWNRVQKELSIKQNTHIIIEAKEEASLEEFEDIIQNIRNLLSLGVGRPVYPLARVGWTERNVYIFNSRKIYNDVNIYYHHTNIPEDSEQVISPHKMLFTFEDISESFESYIQKWFNRSEILAPTYDLYFSTIYTPRLHLETIFLNIAQAIESYHRRKETTEKYELPPEKHTERIEAIIAAIPEEHKEWLNRKLKYSNEVNLRGRLKEILSKHSEITEIFVGDNSKQKSFINKVVNIRNYLTHYDTSIEKIAEVEDLFYIVEKLKVLLEACLLEEMGMDSTTIKNILVKKKERIPQIIS